MVRVALHFGGHAVLDGGDQRAGVGAVVRAGAEDGGVHVWIDKKSDVLKELRASFTQATSSL